MNTYFKNLYVAYSYAMRMPAVLLILLFTFCLSFTVSAGSLVEKEKPLNSGPRLSIEEFYAILDALHAESGRWVVVFKDKQTSVEASELSFILSGKEAPQYKAQSSMRSKYASSKYAFHNSSSAVLLTPNRRQAFKAAAHELSEEGCFVIRQPEGSIEEYYLVEKCKRT